VLGPHLNTHVVAWAEAYLHTKQRHLDPSSHLATTDMAENWGGLCPFWEGELGPHIKHCG